MDRRGPGGLRLVDPIWLARFGINERKIGDYRHGRILFAGDAAHIHSPVGGQGMNTGIQDACNLAWKLAMVIRGTATGDTLLDSYSAERSPVAEDVLKNTTRATHVAVLHNPLGQILRNNVVSLLGGLAPVQQRVAAQMTEIDVAYPYSPLNRILTGAASGHGRPAPGRRAPIDADLARVIGAGDKPQFLLINCSMTADPGYQTLMAKFGEVLALCPPLPESLSSRYGGGLCLVRPDGYVALTAPPQAWDAVADYLTAILA